jgi:hypothetical protein
MGVQAYRVNFFGILVFRIPENPGRTQGMPSFIQDRIIWNSCIIDADQKVLGFHKYTIVQ